MEKEKVEIREHYNSIKEKGKCNREQSITINIRSTNNFIKACLIKLYVKGGESVLDLGCGKGGDLLKYEKAGIGEYHGVDVADISIDDAKARLRSIRCKFKARFEVFDAYNDVMDLHKQFDVISSQFSFHYAFSNEMSLKIALSNVGRHLKLGGYFILTIPSKEAIIEKYRSGRLSNEFYSIELDGMKQGSLIEEQREYRFTLRDSVNGCIEYFVDFSRMESGLKDLGLDLVKRKGFIEFYEESRKGNPELFKRMKLVDLTEKEMEVVGIYEIMVFQKLR